MNRLVSGLAILCFVTTALAGPKGTVPRSSAAQYPIHLQRDGISLGAKLLNREQARKTFVSDVNSCCTVIEIAVYPDMAKPVNLSLNESCFAPRTRNRQLKCQPRK